MGAGLYHGPRERLRDMRGKGACGRKGVPPFDLGEVPSDGMCRCRLQAPIFDKLVRNRQGSAFTKSVFVVVVVNTVVKYFQPVVVVVHGRSPNGAWGATHGRGRAQSS